MTDIKKPKPGTKKEKVVAALKRKNGASIDDLTKATGWQPHTVRAALTGLKKDGYSVTSEKADGVRRYRIEPTK